jgi:TPR repeat protein
MVRSMDLLSWYRRFRSPAPASDEKGARNRADQGDAEAQFGLGLKYGTGPAAALDFVQAAHWFRKAAAQDHGLAQFNLGMMLVQGQGLPKDDAEALTWFRKSAEGGDVGSQYMLGTRCHRSSMGQAHEVSSESRIEAYKWFHLAMAQGYKGSEAARERVTLGMTSEEVTEGNHRAASFVARKAGSGERP